MQQAVKVAARAEMRAFAGDDDAAHIGIAFGRIQSLYPRRIHLRAQRVAVLRVGEAEYQCLADAVAFELCGHGSGAGVCQAQTQRAATAQPGTGAVTRVAVHGLHIEQYLEQAVGTE